MDKKLILLIVSGLIALSSCSLRNNSEASTPDNLFDDDSLPEVTNAQFFAEIDEYVALIRENEEQMTIIKNESENEKNVLFVQDSDTVKISVISDPNNRTDIYYQNSMPIFMIRSIYLDVDSSYAETAYFRNGKIMNCFRDGEEISDHEYEETFTEILYGR